MRILVLISMLLSTSVFAADLNIQIKNIQKNQGFIRLAMYDNASDFPSNYVNAVEVMNIPVINGKAQGTIRNLRKGTYALSVFHDENSDEDLNTNFLGIPKEPFGFSNNPRLLGPPKFRKCKFNFTTTSTQTIYLKRF